MTTTPATHPDRRVHLGAVALLAGGALSLVFHALWRIGHGPTVVNEHGVVLGLTNDQWSHLAGAWMAPVAWGVLVVCSLHRGRLSRAASLLTVAGLALGAASAFIWPLYSVGVLVQYAGIACLAVVVARRDHLPRWPATALWLAVVTTVAFGIAPDTAGARALVLPGGLQGIDLVAVTSALAWCALGLLLLRERPTTYARWA